MKGGGGGVILSMYKLRLRPCMRDLRASPSSHNTYLHIYIYVFETLSHTMSCFMETTKNNVMGFGGGLRGIDPSQVSTRRQSRIVENQETIKVWRIIIIVGSQ